MLLAIERYDTACWRNFLLVAW